MNDRPDDDPIDRAIDTTEETVDLVRFPLTFGENPKRAGQLVVPADVSPGELLGLLAFIAGEASGAILARQRQQPKSRIVLLS